MLIAATITTGLVAGLLFGFACAVMPGLSQVDDAAFVAVMQSINRRILNGWFLVCFVGAPLLTVAALVARGRRRRTTWVPIAGAVLLTGVSYLITATVNVPLNNAVDSAGAMERSAAAGRFEGRWVRWNIARHAGLDGCVRRAGLGAGGRLMRRLADPAGQPMVMTSSSADERRAASSTRRGCHRVPRVDRRRAVAGDRPADRRVVGVPPAALAGHRPGVVLAGVQPAPGRLRLDAPAARPGTPGMRRP